MAFDIYPQDVTVAEILERHGIKYSTTYRGVSDRDGAKMDRFTVRFEKGGETFSTDYYQGSGHRMVGGSTRAYREKAEKIGHSGITRVDISQHLADFPMTTRERAKLSRFTMHVYVAPPTSGSALYSLLSDMRAGDLNFYDFCDEYGYDSDSRKAAALHDTCSLIGREIRPIFRGAIAELETALEDY